MTEQLIALYVLMLFFDYREGFILRSGKYKADALSFAWHAVGWFNRLFIFIIVMFVTDRNISHSVAAVIILWPLFNIACNIGLNKAKWWRFWDFGTTQKFSGMIKDFITWINGTKRIN